MTARPSLPNTFMDVARVFARRATCPRASVGAVLVSPDGVILSQGWNGAPRGLPHCTDVGCDIQVIDGRESCQKAVHAEANCVFNATRTGARVAGATLYVTHAPCRRCTAAIIQAGIKAVVYAKAYGADGCHILQSVGVLVQPEQDTPVG